MYKHLFMRVTNYAKSYGTCGTYGTSNKKERKSTDGAHFTDKCAYLCYKCIRCTAMPF